MQKVSSQLQGLDEDQVDLLDGQPGKVSVENHKEDMSWQRVKSLRIMPSRISGTASFEDGQVRELDVDQRTLGRKNPQSSIKFLETDTARVYSEKTPRGVMTYREDKASGTVFSMGSSPITEQFNGLLFQEFAADDFELDKVMDRVQDKL